MRSKMKTAEADGPIDLIQIYHSHGSPSRRKPDEWRVLVGTIDAIAADLSESPGRLVTTVECGRSGSWDHPLVADAYRRALAPLSRAIRSGSTRPTASWSAIVSESVPEPSRASEEADDARKLSVARILGEALEHATASSSGVAADRLAAVHHIGRVIAALQTRNACRVVSVAGVLSLIQIA